jgi:hypothetical protein
MYFDFNQKSSLLLIFFFNGIVFSYLLFKRAITHKDNPSKWLGWFVLLSTLYISPFLFGYAGWYSKKLYLETLFFIPFQQLFLIGPSFPPCFAWWFKPAQPAQVYCSTF